VRRFGPGLGAQGGLVRAVTMTPGSERIISAAAGESRAALVYEDEAGLLYVVTTDGAPVPVGLGDTAVVAFGPDQVALVKRVHGALYVRTAPAVWALTDAQDLGLLPWFGETWPQHGRRLVVRCCRWRGDAA
jgi:hypothetical protein